MASLNTLRTKFGIVLSIIIALALLAFILSLKTEMGFSGNDPRVGVIDGEKINYSEYYDQYETIKSQNNMQESDEQQSAMLANAAWQALIAKHVLTPGFDRMGLRVTEPERLAMVSGQHPSQAFYNAFADPRTGEYSVAAISQFLAQAETNPEAANAWAQLNEQARLEREVQKYFGLVKGGVYVNSLEVARGVEAANKSFSGKWAGKKFSAVPDSLVKVSSGDVKAYYNSHKNQFKQTPSRTISYVVFEVSPTDDDLLALEKSVTEVGREFAAAEEVKTFVRANRNGRDVYQRDIEQWFNIRRSSVTALLQGMEQDGFITRCAVEKDARLKRLVATDKGRACHAEIEASIAQFESDLQKGIDPQQAAVARAVLEQTLRNAQHILEEGNTN